MSKTSPDTTAITLKSQRYNRFYDAICEYLDEQEGEELFNDFVSVLKEEKKYYKGKYKYLSSIFCKLKLND